MFITKDKIKKAFQEGKLKSVFKYLKKVSFDSEDQSSVDTLESQFNQLERAFANGTINYENRELRLARIKLGLLPLINGIPDGFSVSKVNIPFLTTIILAAFLLIAWGIFHNRSQPISGDSMSTGASNSPILKGDSNTVIYQTITPIKK